jgi:signal transduction histidine kinase
VAFAGELARRASLAVDNARLYREAEAANRLKDLFLATLSHELRTPLNVMIGRTRMLKTAASLTQVHQIADILERNGNALRRLVDDLLDISRMTQGHVALDVQPVQLDALVAAVVHSVQPTAHAKGLTLHVQIAPGLPPVNGDAVRLQQVVWNVLSNAVKFTESGGDVSVTLSVDDHDLVLAVTDSGVGIDPVFLPHVFDMFTQEDATHSRTHGGLGLGLSIVRRLVELHGGHVSATSDGPGRGSTFIIRLPSVTVNNGAFAS